MTTTPGLLDHLTQAAHIVAGSGVTFDEALTMVNEAQESYLTELREQEYRDAIAEIEESNVVYIDFMNRKPKEATHGTL